MKERIEKRLEELREESQVLFKERIDAQNRIELINARLEQIQGAVNELLPLVQEEVKKKPVRKKKV